MQIEVNEQFKFASVWLTNDEKNDADIMESLQPVIQKYREMKYRFVVFQSGTQNLLELTQGLLAHNKNLAQNNPNDKDVARQGKKTSVKKNMETLSQQISNKSKKENVDRKMEQVL